jgi:peptide/nickel transport system substrate-binding protein
LRRSTIALFVLVLASLALAAGCGGDGGDTGTSASDTTEAGEPQTGGTLTSEIDAFVWTGNFDPTGEYLGTFLGLYTNMLGRTLMGYRHLPDAEGNEVIPDLAAEEPEISEDGVTYTFTIRDGVKFGPPLSRDVTSADVEYAFKRIATPALVAQYGFYYLGVIKGLQDYSDAGGLSKPANADQPIAGIETPDDKTIVFTLEKPTGDFLSRLAMPAAGPIPEEVGKCFLKAGEYGRFLISSGPYMIQGQGDLDISSCDAMKALAGFDPNKFLKLERNPDYDPSTDSPEARENFFDNWEMNLNTNAQDIFDKTKAAQVDIAFAGEPSEVIREYTTDPDLEEFYKVNSGDRTWYITMNLTQPPFDDIHVRKAANWIMDKEGLRRAWGGPPKGEIANHIVPDAMFGGELDDYVPYPSDGDAGDLEQAKAEMAQSKYDTNQDGVCDAPECSNIQHITRNTDVWKNMEPVIESSFQKIGLKVDSRELEDSYTVIQTVSKAVPVSSTPGWGKDYADASTFMVLFDSRSILPEGNVNYSLVGLTSDQVADMKVKGTTTEIPTVDADIDACNATIDNDERAVCWQDLDKKLMEEVVPWVPYLDANADYVISPAVVNYTFDQNSGEPAWAHIAVDQTKQQ